jgi:hypothetical protein
MDSNRKVTYIFWLLIYLVVSDVVKDMYQVNMWFQRRFADNRDSMRYGK